MTSIRCLNALMQYTAKSQRTCLLLEFNKVKIDNEMRKHSCAEAM